MTRVIALFMGGFLLASCSSVAEKVVDLTPEWMGGLPKDAPPRPGTPEYDEFQRKQKVERARDKSHDPKPGPCANKGIGALLGDLDRKPQCPPEVRE